MTLLYYPIISGPVAPYSNIAVQPQNFEPRKFDISAITLGSTTTVTTVLDMDYVIGQEVRLIIPPGYGSRELNEIQGFVIAIPAANQANLNINSIGSNSFISAGLPNKAQILAIGDVNTGQLNENGPKRTKPWIPGSFRNISPQ